MPKHHTEDYKLTAVKYYLKNNTTYKNVCDIFMCSERSLKRWIIRYVHGLLSCKNCANVWNRDCNGATNIYKIASNSINKIERPSYLCRNSSGVLDDTSKSKFTRSETSKLC